MNFIKYLKPNLRFAATLIYNIALVMLLFTLCRVMFYLCNSKLFADMTFEHFVKLCVGGTRFDLIAVLYTNLLYILLILIPLRERALKGYRKLLKWVFVVTNSIALTVNCVDIVFYPFTGRRTTLATWHEFSNEDNILGIVGISIIQYWYVTLFVMAAIALMVWLYRSPKIRYERLHGFLAWLVYCSGHTAILLFVVMFTVFGIRGGFTSWVRPITLSNANAYVNKVNEAYIVLNTPFCIYRTSQKQIFVDPHYFKTVEELDSVFNPVVTPKPDGDFRNLNVVVFILESFSQEFSGELNKTLDGGAYRGHTPFLDSLIRNGLTFEYSFATGRKSIDAMPSVLSSIPAFFEPYFLTPYSSNEVSGIARELGNKGYYSAFFHGAPNGSMGFEAFANVSGYKDYFGMTEYGNDDDFDGHWGIWDEEFFQFFAKKMNTFKQPFTTALFSVTSHHPFRVPAKYADRFYDKEGALEIYKVVEYSDFALRRFFETASKMSWFDNTLFVLTADHTNQLSYKEYLNDAGFYKIPIIFYHPKGHLTGRIRDFAQQTDIMPTILSYLRYDRPYVAFGRNLLDSTGVHSAMMYNNPMFQYFEGDYMYQFDKHKFTAIYDFVHDIFLSHNLIGEREVPKTVDQQVKARIQQYVERMINNHLTVDSTKDGRLRD